MERFKKILRGASAVLLAAGMLIGSVVATPASAATLQTTTDATLPDEHVYRMNAFSAETSDLTYDSNWDKSNGNVIRPKQNGATITWRNAGTWLDTDDVEHKIDARITVVKYSGNLAGVNNPSTDNPLRGIKGWFPKLLSQTKKADVTLRVDLYYDNNGQLGQAVPSTFKGVTGFSWIPYVRGGKSESVISLDSGFTGVGNDLTSDTHTRLVTKDSQYGNNAFKVTDNPSYSSNSDFIDETYFSVAFSGPSIQFTMINLPVSNATNMSGFLVGYRRAVLFNRFYDVDNGKQVGTSTPSSISLLAGSVPQGKLRFYEPEYAFQNDSSQAHLRANYDFVETDITSTFYNMFSATTDGTNITATVPSDIDTSQPIYLRSYLKKKRTVTYNANGGTGSMSATKAGEPVATSTFTRSGYHFTGWNTRADGTGQNVKAGEIASFTANTTLYAQWQVASHTVTFDTNGGNAIAPQTVENGKTASRPNATRNGYTLDGWYLDGTKYGFNTPVTQDITLKASWRKTGVTTVKANLHKRLATGSKSGRYKLTLDVKAADIATVTMRNTVISDPLSKWVDPVGLADDKSTGITVTKDGKTITSGYTATYDAKTRTVKVALPGDLADNSTYQVAFEVSLSDTARLDYMRNGTYPDTSDADTGLNAGKKGYCTNSDATLTWDAVTTVDGVPTTVPSKAAYPKPVATWSGANLPAPSVLTNHLPGTGGTASLIPVIAGMGIAIAIATVWVIRRYLI